VLGHVDARLRDGLRWRAVAAAIVGLPMAVNAKSIASSGGHTGCSA
jgi:hypothetical protein